MNEQEYSSGSGFTAEPETTPEPEIDLSPPIINKSPVLYLMRRRNIDYPKDKYQASGELKHGKLIWTPRNENGIEPVPGYMYSNHYSNARFGQVEWIQFKDYNRKNLKWINSLELVID